MKKYNIYFLEALPEYREMILKKFPQAKMIEKKLSQKQIISQCKDAHIICVSSAGKISAEVINNLKNLKLVVTRSAGYNHIDLKTANEKGVVVVNVADYGSHIIAEFVFALLLSGMRNIREGDERVESEKKFSFAGLKGSALKGKTLGLIGTGRIGLHVARIASLGFLMNVVAYDVKPNKRLANKYNFKYVNLEDIYKESDIISLHCPLLKKTKHLINKDSIAKMKDGVIIVNTSRGSLIDSIHLTEAIVSGKVLSAYLDVLEYETNVKRHRDLIDLANVISTPHVAGYADDAMDNMYKIAIKDIDRFIKKKDPKNLVIGI